MNPAVKSRRGATLAELMVAIAVIAVMAVMIVSFTVLLSGHTRGNGENLVFQQDFAMIKSSVESWMDRMAAENKTIIEVGSIAEGEIDAVSLKAGEYVLYFQYGVLYASGDEYRAESVDSVRFDLVYDHGEYLLFCKVQRINSGESYTFCVNPYVGESGGSW